MSKKLTNEVKIARIVARLTEEEKKLFFAQFDEIVNVPTDVNFTTSSVKFDYFREAMQVFTYGAVVDEKRYNAEQAELHLHVLEEKDFLTDLDKREIEVYKLRVEETKKEYEEAKASRQKLEMGEAEKTFKKSLEGVKPSQKETIKSAVVSYFGGYNIKVEGTKFLQVVVDSIGGKLTKKGFTVYGCITVDAATALKNTIYTTYFALVANGFIKPVPVPEFWKFHFKKTIDKIAENEARAASIAATVAEQVKRAAKKADDAKKAADKAAFMKAAEKAQEAAEKADREAKKKAAEEAKKKAKKAQKAAEKAAEKAQDSATPRADTLIAKVEVKKAEEAAKEAKKAEEAVKKAEEAAK